MTHASDPHDNRISATSSMDRRCNFVGNAAEAFELFDKREKGYTKIVLKPEKAGLAQKKAA